tara:strand:- start:278 stop:493 length:216 start_codon:yes stop_codon:yes gene_type:complete
MECQKLDIANIIELNKIRELLVNHPDLLSLLEILIIVCNRRINEEKPVIKLPIERCISPPLSDHSSDSDYD